MQNSINVYTKISDEINISKVAVNNMKKGPKPVVLGRNIGNVDESLGSFAKEYKRLKNGFKGEDKAKGAEIIEFVEKEVPDVSQEVKDDCVNKLSEAKTDLINRIRLNYEYHGY